MKDRYDTLIIGTGCAGYNAAERLYGLGVTDIAIITEGRHMGTSRNTGSDKQTYYKLSLCGGDGDSVREMARTLFDCGAVNGDIALAEAAYSVRCFMHLVELGVPFPANEYGEYVGYKTDHDPRQRATSCGPLTSKLMTEALERAVMSRGIEIIDGWRVVKLFTDTDGICGLAAVNRDGDIARIRCNNIILATGGPAGIYDKTVYPESQTGGSGIAFAAGARGVNLNQWQYGIASTGFRWNVSGTYQQVLPRYISVDKKGTEHEFLYDELGDEALNLVFLKGYQWPFDTAKLEGSSQVDILVDREIQSGRRVFMDFTRNPSGLDSGFGTLSREAYDYLNNSGALFGTPIERLLHMNPAAVELYLSHGIDLTREKLEIAVCAQHCNGGIDIDEHWQSSIPGLYAAGEAAGTFGIRRPGGSALNSTQVGSLRAAEHIAATSRTGGKLTEDAVTEPLTGGKDHAYVCAVFRRRMSECALFRRDITRMTLLLSDIENTLGDYFTSVGVSRKSELADYYRTYDTLITQRYVLSAMLASAERFGSHGSSLAVGNIKSNIISAASETAVTDNERTYFRAVHPIPDPELWFETVWAEAKRKTVRKDNNLEESTK